MLVYRSTRLHFHDAGKLMSSEVTNFKRALHRGRLNQVGDYVPMTRPTRCSKELIRFVLKCC